MTLAELTWTPDNGQPETLTADIPAGLLQQMRDLVGTAEWTSSEAVMWIRCRAQPEAPMERLLFRLSRITSIEPEASK